MSARPSNFRESVTLRDGSQILLRAVLPEDAEGLQDLFRRLSPESVYLRFLEVRKDLPIEQARQFATVDYRTSMAILAVLPDGADGERVVGVARYGPATNAGGEAAADAAIVVEDAYQGRGLGTILLLRLVRYARDHGVRTLRASVHQSNARILHFIEKSGLPAERRIDGGVWDITVDVGNIEELPEA